MSLGVMGNQRDVNLIKDEFEGKEKNYLKAHYILKMLVAVICFSVYLNIKLFKYEKYGLISCFMSVWNVGVSSPVNSTDWGWERGALLG